MKFDRKDLKRLGLPLAVSIVLTATAAGCYFAANDYLQKTKRLSQTAAAQRAEIQAKLASANEEEREIKANLQQYQLLATRGIIGEESRLDWIDTLTAIKSERRLFNIGYSIDPQRRLDYPGFASGGGVEFVSSRVRIEIPLLHEEDLLSFIDDLTKRSRSYVSARSCELTRAEGGGGGGTTLAPRLRAVCVFDLINIRHEKPA